MAHAPLPPARYLLRAKDLVDARSAEPLTVDDLAREAGLSRAHFSVEFRRAFGVSPHAYLLTRRLERAASLLRATDHTVTQICMDVGWSSLGSFTTSFRRLYGCTPSAYRERHPPARDLAQIPTCVLRYYGLPQNRTFREATAEPAAHHAGQSAHPIHRPEDARVNRIATTQLWVHDQDAALEFWTHKLGWEVRQDVTVPEMGNFRWLTVAPAGQHDVAVVLMAIPPAPIMDPTSQAQVRELMGKGYAGTIFLTTEDCLAEVAVLKARGVEFTEDPTDRPYGMDAAFRDPSGNHIRLTQIRPWG